MKSPCQGCWIIFTTNWQQWRTAGLAPGLAAPSEWHARFRRRVARPGGGGHTVMLFQGPDAGLQLFYDQLCRNGLPGNGQTTPASPVFERHLTTPVRTATAVLLTESLPLMWEHGDTWPRNSTPRGWATGRASSRGCDVGPPLPSSRGYSLASLASLTSLLSKDGPRVNSVFKAL